MRGKNLPKAFRVFGVTLFCFLISTSLQANEGARDSASENSNQQMIGAVANGVAGAAFTAQCVSGQMHACALAALSFAQAMMNQSKSGESADVAGVIGDYSYDPYNYDPSGTEYGGNDGGGAGGDGGGGNGSGANDDLMNDFKNLNIPSQISLLESKGFKVNTDEGVLETPDGKVPLSKLGGGSGGGGGLSGLGLSPGQIADAEGIMEEAAEKVMKKYKFGVETGGGGGASGQAKYKRPNIDTSNPLSGLLSQLNKKGRKPASVAGMHRVVGDGEVIGVKHDNIFDMIHRQYQKRRQESYFYEETEPTD
jgi:hypothetical protein